MANMKSVVVIETLLLVASASVEGYNWYSIKTLPVTPGTMTPEPTPTVAPTPPITQTLTPSPTPIPTSCTVSLPTTTLICPSRDVACSVCGADQICVQEGRAAGKDCGYACPVYECRDCPEPVCSPPCGCKEECIIDQSPLVSDSCPVAKCRPLPTCLDCPLATCEGIRCLENFECQLSEGSCHQCSQAKCAPKPCLTCSNEKCDCPRGKKCKEIPGSCYKCPEKQCVEIPDPCADCQSGICAVNPHPNCLNCLPQRRCVDSCSECSPFIPIWSCQNPELAIYSSRTCTSCSSYQCLDECKNCDGFEARCECENPDDCILQPRSCDQCASYYCRKECVADGPGEECKCEDFSLCVHRPGNCFTRSYYECVPPGKSVFEPKDIEFGRQEAKRRSYK